MGLIANLNSWFKNRVVTWLEGGNDPAFTERSYSMVARRDYRLGAQRRFLRKTKEGFDDNVIGNFLGLALDRGISLLFGKPVKFEWDEGVPEETVDFVEAIWEENNKPILLHKLAMYGGEDGTVFAKLVPDASKVNGWRIIAQDPIYKNIICDPDDDERVLQYITQYKTTDLDGIEIARRESIIAGNSDWLIRNEVSSRETAGAG